jgi:hypothetical protein
MKDHEGTPRAALPQYDGAGIIHAHDMENLLGKINSEDAHVCHGTRLLVVNGCPRDRNHSGSLKPHGKEAGPFH